MDHQIYLGSEEISDEDSSKNFKEEDSEEIRENDLYEEDYDDRWDHMYEDIEWHKQKIKIRKSERKINNKIQRDW
jgi:hypothetical protein